MLPRFTTRARVGAAIATAAVAAVSAVSAGPAQAATNDPLYAKQWGPRQVRAEQAWSTSTGAGTVIAVVDTGVDLGHPDLVGKLVTGATFVGCNPSCGNGDWRGRDGVGQDLDSHGTHVAGIAAAATNNGVGIAGVAPDAKVMPVKVLEDGSGAFEDIAAGIRYAADHGADVVNLSLGGMQGTQALVLTGLETSVQDAIAYARAKAVMVVAAAGNDSVPVCNTPGSDDGVSQTGKLSLPAAATTRTPRWVA